MQRQCEKILEKKPVQSVREGQKGGTKGKKKKIRIITKKSKAHPKHFHKSEGGKVS